MTRFLVEILVRGGALCLATWLSLCLLRRSAAAYRHALCVLALVGLAALPLLCRLVPPVLVTRAVIERPEPSVPSAMPEPGIVPVYGAGPRIVPESPSLTAPAPRPVRLPNPLILLWAGGAVALGLRLLFALRGLRALAETGVPVDGAPDLRLSARIETPMTWGLRRPVILLPTALRESDAAFESAVRHERAHIERRDWAWHLLAEAICALFWFQPGAWWLRRRLRAESERACDDRVLASGIAGADYAAHLVAILKTRRGETLAPGMANIGPLEARVRHLLEPDRPRCATRRRLIVALALGAAFAPVAALRVEARERATPVVAPPRQETRVDPVASVPTSTPPTSPALSGLAAPPALALAPSTGVAAQPPAAPGAKENAVPPVPMDRVVWGETVDGLQPGFLMLGSSHVDPALEPSNSAVVQDRIPDNSLVTYRVLLRNATDRPIAFFVRLLPYEGMDVPYLSPSNMGEDRSPQFRARPATRRQPVDPAYSVTLKPGEAIFVPGRTGEDNLELFVGAGGPGTVPGVTVAQPGTNWIVQPLTVKVPPADDRTPYSDLMGLYTLTRIDRKGVAKTEMANRIDALSGGKTLYAKIQLEVGTRNAEAFRTARVATWGKVDRGMQCGIRAINPRAVYRLGDTIEAEVLWRNVTGKPVSTPIPRASDLYPLLRDSAGRELTIDFGPRLNLYPGWFTMAAGEVRSLGTVRLTLVSGSAPSPSSNLEPAHLKLPSGTYKLSAFGGVGAPEGGNPESGRIEFHVVID